MRLYFIFLSLLINASVLCSVSEKLTENKTITHLVSKSFEFREKFGFDLLRRYSEEGFAAGTLVATPDGFKSIETIKKNDLILDHHGISKKVFKVATKNVSQVICCSIDAQEIFTGRDQLFNVSCSQKWCKACYLKNYGIQSSLIQESVKLYQLTVEDHIFVVEESNIVVHNVDFLVTPAGALYVASMINPVTAVIGATVGLSALAYSAYMIHQAEQVAHLSQIAMHQNQQEQIKNGIVCAVEKDVVKTQEVTLKADQISENIQCNKALERRSKTLEKLKKVCKEQVSVSSAPDPLKPEDEEEKKIKEEEEFKKKHPKGRYKDADYHKNYQSGNKSPRPRNGQDALDRSFEVPDKEKARIALSESQFVVLRRTMDGLYHGYVSTWSELTIGMKKVLIKQGLVTKLGKII